MVMESKDLIGIDCDLNDLVHRLHCSVLPLMEVPSLSLPCPTFQYWCLVACGGGRWLRICSLLASSVVVGLDLRATNRSSCERVRGGAVSSVPCPL